MTDTIDNAFLCERVLGWTLSEDRKGYHVETHPGVWPRVPDFSLDIAAAMELWHEVAKTRLIQVTECEGRVSCYITPAMGGDLLAESDADTPAAAITQACMALVKGESDE